METFARSDAKGTLTRSCGNRHPLSHSIEHLSLDMVDHYPSNIPESSFPSEKMIFSRTNDATHMIIEDRSQNFETYHELTVLWIGYLRESILDSCLSIPHVRTTAQLADMLTTIAFTTLQFESLMRLFNIHPPSYLNVDHSLSAQSCAAFSFEAPLAMSNANSAHRDLESGPWE